MPTLNKDKIKEISTMNDVSDFVVMKTLIYMKEQTEIEHMIKKLQELILENGVKFYDAWMTMLSDDILSLSTAFGERFFLESALIALENDCLHEATRDVLKKVITLHMMTYLNENMGWYLKNKFVTIQAARDLHSK